MTQETQHEKYTRLAAIIESTYDDHELTSDEKREIGDILADNMTPYEYSCDVKGKLFNEMVRIVQRGTSVS